jgi:hypothetical protein
MRTKTTEKFEKMSMLNRVPPSTGIKVTSAFLISLYQKQFVNSGMVRTDLLFRGRVIWVRLVSSQNIVFSHCL